MFGGLTVFGKLFLIVIISSAFLTCATELLPTQNPEFVSYGTVESISFKTGKEGAIINGLAGSLIDIRKVSESEEVPMAPMSLTAPEPPPEERSIIRADIEDRLVRLAEMKIASNSDLTIRSLSNNGPIILEIASHNRPVSAKVIWEESVNIPGNTKEITIRHTKIEAKRLEIVIENPSGSALIDIPRQIEKVQFVRNRHIESGTVFQSSVIGASVDFYMFGYPIKSATVRRNEWLDFNGITAEITELSISENSLRYSIVGNAETAVSGFHNYRADLRPSIREVIVSLPHIALLITVFFSVLLGLLGVFKVFRNA